MKILHTADWHLGKRLDTISRQQEQQDVLEEICTIASDEGVHAVIIAGDLFDIFNPSSEATELFYRTLKKLTNQGRRPVIAIAGNHDSPDRIEAPDPLARECGIIFAGYPNAVVPLFKLETGLHITQSEEGFIELLIPGCTEPLRILLTPYANEYRLRTFLGTGDTEQELRDMLAIRWKYLADKYCDTQGCNILLSHLLVIHKGDPPPEEPDDEKPILHIGGAQAIFTENIPPQIQYTALGHLHRKQMVAITPGLVCYPGSPLSYSFGEANQKKYVMLVDIQPGIQASVRAVEITSGKILLRKKAYSVEEAIVWLKEHDDCLVELTMITDTFLLAEERKRLYASHPGIVALIPEVLNGGASNGESRQSIDLTKDIHELFIEYFKHEKGQTPGANLLQLFKEVLAADSNTTSDIISDKPVNTIKA